MPETETPPVQQPPKLTETGVALIGNYPANHRLRAEALADAGKETDPDEVVTPDQIKDAAGRLAADAKAAEDAKAKADAESKALGRKSADELRKIAADEGVPVETDDNKPDLVRKIEDHRAAKAAQ